MIIKSVSENIHMIDVPYMGKIGVLGTYVIKGEKSIVVDPGPTASITCLVRGLEGLGVKKGSITYVAPTHIHLDHAGGSWKMLEKYPEARLLVHPKGSLHMIEPSKLESAARSLLGKIVDGYGDVIGVPRKKVFESHDGEEVDLGGVSIRVLWTPGHSSHHQCFYEPEGRAIIIGDAGGQYFPEKGIVMPTSPPPFNPVKAVESIEEMLALKPKYICYAHFGVSDNAVEMLEGYKSQIILWKKIVEEGICDGLGLEEIFRTIVKEDPMAMRMGEFSPEMSERSSMVSLLGFVEYYNWRKEKRI